MLQPVPVRSSRPLLSPLCFAIALVAACGGTPAPKAENHACFRALDCQAGLVCVEGRCTADLTPIVPEGSAAGPAPAAPIRDAGSGSDDYD